MTHQHDGPASEKDASSDADSELEAIRSVIAALTDLSDEARQRVMGYVINRMALAPLGLDVSRVWAEEDVEEVKRPALIPRGDSEVRDIRTLKERKLPRSAIEMAVLVAYYLAETAAPPHRKTEIGTEDIITYFKQAGYPIPGRPRKTLSDAKAAGYLDSPSQGSYRLNPVGHNLIAHSLPAQAADTRRTLRKSGKKKAQRKTERKIRR